MKPPPPAEIEAAVRRLAESLARWGARKVILYGKETADRLPERSAEALDRCSEAKPPLPVEPLVYTPAEFARLVAEENLLVGEAARHGRVLHDAA